MATLPVFLLAWGITVWYLRTCRVLLKFWRKLQLGALGSRTKASLAWHIGGTLDFRMISSGCAWWLLSLFSHVEKGCIDALSNIVPPLSSHYIHDRNQRLRFISCTIDWMGQNQICLIIEVSDWGSKHSNVVRQPCCKLPIGDSDQRRSRVAPSIQVWRRV